MSREKNIGIVLAGSGNRKEIEELAYERISPIFLAYLKKMISKGYREKGEENEVTVRLSITDYS